MHRLDFIEHLRESLYPKLHASLQSIGNIIGVPLYATGQHPVARGRVTATELSEDRLEKQLSDAGAIRNPIAAFKELSDGRQSEGSWVFLESDYDDIGVDMQLHLTLFPRADGQDGRVIFAHYEADWRQQPLQHLRAEGFDFEQGVELTEEILTDRTVIEIA